MPDAPQRPAEGGYALEQVGVVLLGGGSRLRDRAGVDVLDPDAIVKFGPVGHVHMLLLGVYGHLVTLPGEVSGELAESQVIAVRA